MRKAQNWLKEGLLAVFVGFFMFSIGVCFCLGWVGIFKQTENVATQAGGSRISMGNTPRDHFMSLESVLYNQHFANTELV